MKRAGPGGVLVVSGRSQYRSLEEELQGADARQVCRRSPRRGETAAWKRRRTCIVSLPHLSAEAAARATPRGPLFNAPKMTTMTVTYNKVVNHTSQTVPTRCVPAVVRIGYFDSICQCFGHLTAHVFSGRASLILPIQSNKQPCWPLPKIDAITRLTDIVMT